MVASNVAQSGGYLFTEIDNYFSLVISTKIQKSKNKDFIDAVLMMCNEVEWCF